MQQQLLIFWQISYKTYNYTVTNTSILTEIRPNKICDLFSFINVLWSLFHIDKYRFVLSLLMVAKCSSVWILHKYFNSPLMDFSLFSVLSFINNIGSKTQMYNVSLYNSFNKFLLGVF